ncbi:MAG: hypothetical protein ACRCXT_22150 [Paraclostridium sp.]
MEQLLSKKAAKELLLGKNQVSKRVMTKVEQATYMCDHRYDDGRSAVVQDRERPENAFCPICKQSWYGKVINKIDQAKAKDTFESMIQMIKVGTPFSDAASLEFANFQFMVDQLPSYYQAALATGEVTNKNATKQATNKYDKYGAWMEK